MYTKKGLTLFTLLSLLLLSTTATAQLETTEQENSTGFPSGLIDEISSLLTRDSGNLITGQFAGGDGSSSNPYQISTCQELQNIQNNRGASYELVNDIDCSGFNGFNGIGLFYGDFLDGQGYVVENLEINEGSSDNVGLLESVQSGSEVKNIGLVNADITGNITVGGLVGYNSGSVSNSYVTGSVTGDDIVGGLVGVNYQDVSNSYSTGSVSGNNRVGGLAGDNDGSVSKSYATGSVSGNDYVGGLAGANDGSVSNSYVTGSVSGSDLVGGLVGRNIGDGGVSSSYSTGDVESGDRAGGLVAQNSGSVSKSYATGSISGGNWEAGVVGLNYQDVSNSYWDEQSTGQSTGIDYKDGNTNSVTGLTTSQMQGSSASSNMPDLDFTNNWTTVLSSDSHTTGDGYSILQGLDRQSQLEAQGIYSNSPPIPSFSSNTPVLTGEDFGLDASGSTDPNSDSLTYEWDTTGDGDYNDATGVSPSVSRGSPGNYTIGLRVTDDHGATSNTLREVTVNNRDPSASFSFTPSNPSIGRLLTFDARSSSDQDGSISSYEWDWDDDGNYEDTSVIAYHIFSAPGEYNVELNVTDDKGATNTSSRTVTVSDDTNPSINNPSPIGTVNTNSPTISAGFSDNYDLNSYILELDGSQVASGSISGTSDSVSYSASGLSFGQHTYNFSVEDSSGNRISGQETFTVSLLNSKPNPNTVEGALWVQSSDLRWGNGTYEFWLKDVSVSNTGISGPSGAIWIQGTEVHWIDQNSDERAYKGRLVQGGASSPKGALWFQNGFIHYIDENGDERVADGT